LIAIVTKGILSHPIMTTNRFKAIEKMKKALNKFVIAGIPTTAPFLEILLRDDDFINMKTNTRWLESCLERFLN